MSATAIRVHYPGDPNDTGTVHVTSARGGYVEWRTGETDYVRRDDTGAWWSDQGDDPTPEEVHVRNPGSGWRFQTGTKLVTMETP